MRPDELKLLDTLAERFAYSASWSGLLRILGWTVAFLLVLNVWFSQTPYLQKYAGLDGETLYPMMARAEETHWARIAPHEFPAGEKTNIAWVAGSGIRMPLDNGLQIFVPELTLNELRSRHGIDAQSWVYYIQAARPLDIYTATIDAIVRKPDALYLEINPIWVYNNMQLYGFENLRNGGATTWRFTQDPALQLLIATPGNHLWSGIGKHLPRLPLGLSQGASQWFFDRIAREPSITLTEVSDGSDKLIGDGLTQGFQVWLNARVNRDDLGAYRIPGASNRDNIKASVQGAVMMQADPEANTWPARLLRQQLEAIASSDLPAVVYVAPLIESNIVDPGLREAYQAILAQLRSVKTDFDSDNRLLLVDFPPDIIAGVEQLDYVHMANAGELPAYLALEMSKLVVTPETGAEARLGSVNKASDYE